jgi:hypothetical protein
VSTEPVRGQLTHARHADPQPVNGAAGQDASANSEQLDFVRFCYQRRRVSWPALYDEMCAVASRGHFRGMGYAELVEHGISFCLPDLPRLAALTELVVAEERARVGALRGERAALSAASAPG